MKLELRDLACGYEAGSPIIKNITFDLEAGDTCALLGPNGVGKTTLFKTILCLIRPLAGQVCIRRGNVYYINNTLEGGYAELSFKYGKSSDEALVGTWNSEQ